MAKSMAARIGEDLSDSIDKAITSLCTLHAYTTVSCSDTPPEMIALRDALIEAKRLSEPVVARAMITIE